MAHARVFDVMLGNFSFIDAIIISVEFYAPPYFKEFAADQNAFFAAFSDAYIKMTGLGVPVI